MAVIRVNKTKDYTVMSNFHLREKEMSLKAKGLLSIMLSLPETWDYSIAGLVAICVEKESAIVAALKELKRFGYLQVCKLMPNETDTGRIEYVYNVFERPTFTPIRKDEIIRQLKQGQEKQAPENLGLENQDLENPGQLSIKKSITEQSNTDDSKKKERKGDSFDRLIEEYCSTIPEEKRDRIRDLLKDWLKVRKAKRAAMTDRAIELNLQKLTETAAESGMGIAEYIEEVICRGWQAFYPIGNNRKRGNEEPQKGGILDQYNRLMDKYGDEGGGNSPF